ncbi:MAG: hypothetical protein KGZ73_15040 [Rhizobiales bacterium]|nr:hypothetical protein [Hyphomicrobiales bacterium]
MLKATLIGAAAAGTLAVASAMTPVAAAPAAQVAPQVEKNVNDVHDPRWRHRHHRHRHHHHGYYYYGPSYYYTPGPGIYFRAW